MFKVGDTVWVPISLSGVWEPHPTKVKAVETFPIAYTNYTVEVPVKRYALREELHSEDVKYEDFQVFGNYQDCRKHIAEYYYDGLCNGCQYEDRCGHIWTCDQCECAVRIDDKTPRDSIQVCKLNGLKVAKDFIKNGMECCKFFAPVLPQDKKAYQSWEHYEDVLRNCEFNPSCPHHTKSAHSTVDYDWYLTLLVHVPVSFDYNGREVRAAVVPRKMWQDQTFMDGDNITCKGLCFKPILTKVGLIKKGTEPGVMFEKLRTINIKTGQLLG